MTRLFLGVPVDEAARQALWETARALSARVIGRYLDPSLYHITLAFLGETGEDSLPRIFTAMEDAARGVHPFQVALGGVGSFGTVLWRGLQDDRALFLLAGRLRASLASQGVPFDKKPFKAHITLARDAGPPPDAPNIRAPEASFWVRSLTLFESARPAGKLAYLPRREVRL